MAYIVLEAIAWGGNILLSPFTGIVIQGNSISLSLGDLQHGAGKMHTSEAVVLQSSSAEQPQSWLPRQKAEFLIHTISD